MQQVGFSNKFGMIYLDRPSFWFRTKEEARQFEPFESEWWAYYLNLEDHVIFGGVHHIREFKKRRGS